MRSHAAVLLILGFVVSSCSAHRSPGPKASVPEHANASRIIIDRPMFATSLSVDCNANGLSDSLDLATGVAFDNDNDSIPDDCFVDSNYVSIVYPPNTSPDPVGIDIKYWSGRQIRVALVAQADGHHVRAIFKGPDMRRTLVADTLLSTGFHAYIIPVPGQSSLPDSGRAQVIVTVDSTEVIRELAWNWNTRRKV